MIKYYNGSLFNVRCDAYVNTVNCVGVMGAGIALEFKLRYPDMYKKYEEQCKSHLINTGKVIYYTNADSTITINFPTKYDFKYPSQLTWIERGLQDFIKTYKYHNIKSVAFPKLGCNNGGLDWNIVKYSMEKYLTDLDIDVYICLNNLNYAEGKEKIMMDAFNDFNINELSKHVKLNSKQKQILQNNKPYKRFFQILESESIGIKTYSELFHYFYNYNEDNQQLTLL